MSFKEKSDPKIEKQVKGVFRSRYQNAKRLTVPRRIPKNSHYATSIKKST